MCIYVHGLAVFPLRYHDETYASTSFNLVCALTTFLLALVELSSGTMDEVNWLDAPCLASLLSWAML